MALLSYPFPWDSVGCAVGRKGGFWCLPVFLCLSLVTELCSLSAQVCSQFTGAGKMWPSGSGGQRRNFPWGPLRAAPLRWTAKLCCSWPKRTFDTGPLIQVRIVYRSCHCKERGSCSKSWRGSEEEMVTFAKVDWEREGIGRTETLVWGKDKKDKEKRKSWYTWVVGIFECKFNPEYPTCL